MALAVALLPALAFHSGVGTTARVIAAACDNGKFSDDVPPPPRKPQPKPQPPQPREPSRPNTLAAI